MPGLTDPPFQGDYTTPCHAPGVHASTVPEALLELCNWIHIHSFRVNPSSQSLCLGSPSLQSPVAQPPDPLPGVTCPWSTGNAPPRTCTWGHMATVSRVNPYQTLCPRSHVESPGLLPPRPTAPWVTCPDSRVTLPDPAPGSAYASPRVIPPPEPGL